MEQNWSERKRKRVGEAGMPDCLAIRYSDVPITVMWIEFKRPGGKPSQAQLVWHRDERARGALTLIAGVDFEPTIEGFMAYYAQSGLKRR